MSASLALAYTAHDWPMEFVVLEPTLDYQADPIQNVLTLRATDSFSHLLNSDQEESD